MKVSEIVSSDNQRLKLIRSLAQSSKRKNTLDEHELILLEGTKVIQEALNHAIELLDVIVSQTYYEGQFNESELAAKLESITIVKDNIFKGLYTTDTSCGVIASARPKKHDLNAILSKRQTLLIADNLQDPGNLGTIIRTAYAFASGGLILSKGSVDCYNPKVIRSSMGAIFALPIVNHLDLKTTLPQLKQAGYQIVALDGKAQETIWQFQPKGEAIAYILGNEGHGIAAEIVKMADNTISIPINPNCESLNVAVAAGIILVRDKLQGIN